MKFIHLRLILLFLIFTYSSLFAQKLTLFTEEFPPFNFTKNKKLTGVSTQIIEAVMKKAGFEYQIRSLPWARAYKMSQAKPNSFIFSISRREKREDLFKWVGIIAPSTHSVFALKNRSDIKIEQLEDLKNYEIGTSIEDSRETYLVSKGFEISKFQRVAGENAYLQNYKKLKRKRIDLWPAPDALMNYIVKKAGDSPGKILKKAFVLSEISTDGFYLAASLSTKDAVIDKIRRALRDFKKTKEYQMILKRWGL